MRVAACCKPNVVRMNVFSALTLLFLLLSGPISTGTLLLAAMPLPIRWGYVDKLGHWAIPPQFDRADEVHDGLAKVSAKGEEFFIDKSGKRVAIQGSEDVSPFSEGFA